MHDAVWDAVNQLAQQQHGLVTRKQVIAAGATKKDWAWLLRRNWLSATQRGVYEVFPEGPWLHRQLQCALLKSGEGTVVSHRSAARVHGLWGVNGYPIELTTRTRWPSTHGATLHCRELPKDDVIRRSGLPVTSMRGRSAISPRSSISRRWPSRWSPRGG